jgi:hypothetical protein
MCFFLVNPGAPRCEPELHLLNLHPKVQVQVQHLAAPNLNVQVQVQLKQPEHEPNRTLTSLFVMSYNYSND